MTLKQILLLCLLLSTSSFGLGGEEPPTDDPPPVARKVKKKCLITTVTDLKDGKQEKKTLRFKARSKDACVEEAERLRAIPVSPGVKSRNVHYDWVGPLE